MSREPGITLRRRSSIGDPASSSVRWFVLHTRSRQEKALAETLTGLGVQHFLPVSRQPRYYGPRKRVVEIPLFPCYLFLHGTLEQAYEADRTGRVANVIEVADQHRLAHELTQIRTALSQDAGLTPYAYLHGGVRVEVIAGPFRGVQGVIEKWSRSGRLVLQVQALGQAVSMEIEPALLKPVD